MFIADFHIHSKYSRATSRECVPEHLDLWARRKGLDLIGTGDFTHPAWRRELREKLVPTGDGLYTLGDAHRQAGAPPSAPAPRFMVTGEISSIYKKNGRVRKVHNLLLLPSLEAAETLSTRLEAIGNLHSDGRPILGLDSRDLLEITLEVCPDAMLIPAHIWTPHFSLFGAYSGFDAIEECFGDLTGHIHALETGLSSNPTMNWRLSALDRFALVSNSDAHSPGNLAREANLFDTQLTYPHIARALADRNGHAFRGTLEFYPEEGKYHFDGHRNCQVCQSPGDTLATGGTCPVCGGRITVGVLHRVEALADREEGYAPAGARPYESLIPLPEVLAASIGYSAKSQKGQNLYRRLLQELGPELYILREAPADEVGRIAGPAAAEGLRRLRTGQVTVRPGYDGEYGKVQILSPAEIQELSGQMRLFFAAAKAAGGTPAVPKRALRRKEPAVAGEKPPAPPPFSALEGLNGEQQAAAFSPLPVTAVVAGPGTGKTKTLVARIAYLVEQGGVSPAHITAVTFTNKAAGEMRERLEQHFGGKRKVRSMTIGTFHSICLELLRQQGDVPAVSDDATARTVVEEVLGEGDWKLSPKETLQKISLHKCGAAVPGSSLPPELLAAYNRRMADYGVMDFDDILIRALEAELSPKSLQRFAHLLVDEFQDVNPVQYRLVRQWSRDSRGLFVIGDPNQSVYGFRGSDARCFQWLERDYPGLVPVPLFRNYRSTPQILGAAVPVLSGEARQVKLESQQSGGEKIRLMDAGTPFAEALFVAKEINRMLGGIDMLDSGQLPAAANVRGFSDIAVLYRTNRQAALLEECLVQEGIPYLVAGRASALSHPGAAGLLAFFRLLHSPGDLGSLRRCLEGPARCAPAQVREVMDRYRRSPRDLPALSQVLGESAAHGGELALLAASVEKFASQKAGKPQKLVAQWAAEWGLEQEDWVDKLLRTAVFHSTMTDLLANLALGQEGDVRRYGGKRYSPDAVSLMTLHGAKGLEFPVVFLCGVTQGLLPHPSHGGQTAPWDEERRLLYVGMTRAREELVLLHHGAPSPFLEDLPEDLLQREQARRARQAPAYRQCSLFD